MWCAIFRTGLVLIVVVFGPALSQPVNNTIVGECSTSNDCASGMICVDLNCIADPCDNLCGLNADCIIQEAAPICACKTGYEGDVFKECKEAGKSECTQDTDCPLDKACMNRVCVDPCVGRCGLNTDCKVANHHPICGCLKGFAFSPKVGCKSILEPECQINLHCPENLACRQQRCVDPCGDGVCGNNTVCNVKSHYPVCACKIGYVGDALNECVPSCSQGTENESETKKDNEERNIGKKYLPVYERRNWFEALIDCNYRGMKLATVNSSEEEMQLKNTFLPNDYWLGGHDLGTERYREYVWFSIGKTMSYTNWKENEPSGDSNHCLLMRDLGNIYRWISSNCDQGNFYICES